LSTPDLEGICKSIFKMDRRIRYVGFLNEFGKVIAGGQRRGVTPLEPKSEELRLMAHLINMSGLRDSWEAYFGKTLANIFKREYVTIALFPFTDFIAVVSAEPDYPIQNMLQIRDFIAERISMPLNI
jgi:hypothetical protein